MKKDTMKIVKEAIVSHFINKNEDSTVKEIAKRTGLSEGTIRKNVDYLMIFGHGIICTEKENPIYSKSYKGHLLRTTLVTAYGPSRKLLVEMIKNGRKES